MTLPPSRLSTFFHAHLVSDSTGDTLATIARAVTARFDALIPIEHAYPLVRSTRQLERVLNEIEDAPWIVISLQEIPCRSLTTPIASCAASRIGPCSICSST